MRLLVIQVRRVLSSIVLGAVVSTSVLGALVMLITAIASFNGEEVSLALPVVSVTGAYILLVVGFVALPSVLWFALEDDLRKLWQQYKRRVLK